MLNIPIVIRVISVVLMLVGFLMLLIIPFSIYYDEGGIIGLGYASFLTCGTGAIGLLSSRKAKKNIGKREGYLIVGFSWITVALFAAIPYIMSNTFELWTQAFFESVSGLTTTGATALTDIEVVPKGILLWRSLTQWLGGMGIIVLTVALFPLLGIGGVELFIAEAPGPTSEKIHPRIKETAKRLWFIYVGLTALLFVLLAAQGMGFYDSLNHALTTMATGGFSTKNDSIAYFDQASIQYTITLFMMLAGVNYILIYFAFKFQLKKVWSSEEFRVYLLAITVFTVIVLSLVLTNTDQAFEPAFRMALFQVVSMITTTGFITADYTLWSPLASIVFFLLLFIGASAGSTSGGIKIIRHLVFFKNSFLELKRLIHPKAIIRAKIDKKIVHGSTLAHVLVFLLLYLLVFVVGTFIMGFILSDFDQPVLTAVGSVATCLGNVGPSIGSLGPVDNFAAVPELGKCVLILIMLIGRLELFTILVIFTPYFWKVN